MSPQQMAGLLRRALLRPPERLSLPRMKKGSLERWVCESHNCFMLFFFFSFPALEFFPGLKNF